jgi:hypothetical protein
LLIRFLSLEVQESAYGIVITFFFTREQADSYLFEGGTGTQGLYESLKDIQQRVTLPVYNRLKGLLELAAEGLIWNSSLISDMLQSF